MEIEAAFGSAVPEGADGRPGLYLSDVRAGLRPRAYMTESLILAQNERWRRVLSMQVGRQGPSGP